MPDAEPTRKRSRSPSDTDAQQQQAKRPNTGAEQPSRVKAEEDAVSAASSPVAAAPDSSAVKSENGAASAAAATPPIGNIHMRCLIVTQDASIIIGKAGAHVNEIREKSGAKVMVSESLPGNPERILNVSGPLDAVSKVFVVYPAYTNHAHAFDRRSASSFAASMTSRLTNRQCPEAVQ
jgi:heterogeneous nuclear rnp K-like protein 2